MNKVQLEISGLVSGHTSKQTTYTLILGEVGGNRRIPVVIGAFEAQAIALVLEDIKPQRPLTHDLFKNLADSFDIDVLQIFISNLIEGVFYAKVVCLKENQEIEIDARTSDAVALAVRFNCPIFTTPQILDAVGIEPQQTEDEKPGRPEDSDDFDFMKDIVESDDYSGLDISDLEILLNEALQDEDYSKAAQIRDEIKRRKK
ncbi:MAG: bifunctional nuclease family protein [Flavobacteriales bacterium]|nr:bifunctional nuclease family protein [Flavobacteriales bacterium]